MLIFIPTFYLFQATEAITVTVNGMKPGGRLQVPDRPAIQRATAETAVAVCWATATYLEAVPAAETVGPSRLAEPDGILRRHLLVFFL